MAKWETMRRKAFEMGLAAHNMYGHGALVNLRWAYSTQRMQSKDEQALKSLLGAETYQDVMEALAWAIERLNAFSRSGELDKPLTYWEERKWVRPSTYAKAERFLRRETVARWLRME